jgi:hypothetical protein
MVLCATAVIFNLYMFLYDAAEFVYPQTKEKITKSQSWFSFQ